MAVALIAWPATAARGDQYIYSTSLEDITRVSLDGFERRQLANVGSQPQFDFEGIRDIEADASGVYWTAGANPAGALVGFVDEDGNNTRLLATLDRRVSGLAVSSRHLYFAWRQGDGDNPVVGIGRMNLDGSDVVMDLVTGLPGAASLATSGDWIYWSWSDDGSGWIGRAALDGSNPVPRFISAAEASEDTVFSLSVAANSRHLYWTYPGYIGRSKPDGTDIQRRFRRVFGGGGSIALSRSHVYWGEQLGGSMGRMGLSGSDVFANFPPTAAELVAVSPDTRRRSRRCSIAETSIVRGRRLEATCKGVSGRVNVIIAGVLNRRAAAPAGTLSPDLRISGRVRRGRLSVSTRRLCPEERFRTGRYRIFFMREGSQEIGTDTVRIRLGQSGCGGDNRRGRCRRPQPGQPCEVSRR